MKRIILSLAASSLFTFGAVAQNTAANSEYPYAPGKEKASSEATKTYTKNKKSSAVAIWSEDFSGGIPMGWTNQGYDVDPATGNFTPNPLNNWEYRGTSTTPNNTTGSRGAYAAGTGPIASPTASNGFIIFDSDYRDNGGTPGGTGTSPAPHYATLTTTSIDLTGYPFVELSMSSHLRQYSSRFLVAISIDGGTTYADTAEFGQNVALNSSSANPESYTADISVAGDESNVVLQFIFDGTPEVNTAAGPAWAYYYWQIDDVEINELPANAFKFTDFGGAPAHDVIYPANHPKYGNPQVEQAAQLPINFDSNILNFGYADQYNVRLNVDIVDESTGSVVTSLQSPALAVLNAGDTGSFADFTTSSGWTPSMVGDYDAVFYVTSDSSTATTPYDTIAFDINDLEHASHFGFISNTIGISSGVLGLAQALTFPADVDTNGYVAVSSMGVYLSTVSDTTGSIIVEIYDTTGFSYGAGGGPAGTPFVIKSFPLNASNIGTTANIDLTTNFNPVFLPSNGGYLVVINLVSPSGDIRIGNDQTVTTPPGLIGMLFNDGNWYSGFSNSSTLSNLIVNLRVVRNIGIEEAVMKQNSISLFPNPTNNGVVNFELGLGGSYDIEVTSVTGQRVYSETVTVNGGEVLERNFSNLKSGSYLVNFTSEEIQMTKKLVIE